MKLTEKETLLVGDWLLWRKRKQIENMPGEIIKEVRISPISYRMGEHAGFQVGICLGFTMGMFFGLFILYNVFEKMV